MHIRACEGGGGGDTQTLSCSLLHTHTNTGHEEKGGVCGEKGRRREEARLAARRL